MKIREIEKSKFQVLSEKKSKGGDVMLIRAPFLVVDRKNKNGRTYPKALVEREIKRIQDAISKGSFIGSGDHSETGVTMLKDTSHIITKMELGSDGKAWLEAKILPTERGNTIQTIIKNSGMLGLSARGFGNISRTGEVMSDYKLMGVDVVTSPSEDSAHFDQSNIFESQNFQEEEDQDLDPNLDPEDVKRELQRKADLEEEYSNLLFQSFENMVEDGSWKGDFESYKKHFGSPVREVLGLENSQKKKLTAEQKNKKLLYAFHEARTSGYAGTMDEWKKQCPEVVKLVLGEKKEEENLSLEQKQNLVREAAAAGVDPSDKKAIAKYISDAKTIREKKQPTADEALEEEAQRIYKGMKADKPNSQVTIESTRRMLLKERESKIKEIKRKRIIAQVNRDFQMSGGSKYVSVEKLVFEALEEADLLTPREKNWKIFRDILSSAKTK